MPGMRAPRPAGHPVSRTAARWVFDVLVMLLAAASALPDLVHNGDQARTVELAVLALEVAPLLVRRVWPLPVFGWAVAAGMESSPNEPCIVRETRAAYSRARPNSPRTE